MLAAAIFLQAGVAAPVFAPPLDTVFRAVTERAEGPAGERRYRLERLIRFSREGQGYRAEAVLIAADAQGPEALGSLVEAGFGSLAGEIMVFHLDGGGAVTEIDRLAELWERVCARIAETAAERRSLPTPARAKLAERIAAPLRALPPERQRAMLGSFVTALIMAEPVGAAGASAPVRIAGASPFGKPVMLEGTRETRPAANGDLETITRASAQLSVAAEGGAPARTGSVRLDRLRRFDPATGLIALGVDTNVSVADSADGPRETRLVTRISIAPAPGQPVAEKLTVT